MIFDVCNLSDKIGAILLPISQTQSDCSGQLGNLIVAA